MERILAVDYGSKIVGIAVSDELNIIARGVTGIQNKGEEFVVSEIKKICQEFNVGKVVVGNPLGLSGRETKQTKAVNKFVKILKSKLNVPIEPLDERLSSALAEKYLLKKGRAKSKEQVDIAAAKILLQDYLNKK